MSCFQILHIGNSIVMELGRLTNSVTGEPDLAAAVEVTVLGPDGQEVAGATWPTAMAHAGAGTYRATLPPDLALIEDAFYTAIIVASGAGSQVGRWEITCKADKRAR